MSRRLSIILALLVASRAFADKPVDFTRDIRPIFQQSCTECHDAKKHKADLRLDNKTDAFRGGETGKAIIPGHSKESLLMKRIRGEGDDDQMPVKKPPLSAEQMNLIAAWIDQGAVWPEGIDGPVAKNQVHWAYVKPVRPEPPKVGHEAWVRNPVDRFVAAKLEKEGLEPSVEAPKEMLIRRVTLDLIGLPPTPAEVDAFVKDDSPNAYETVVDRLLASPHFGERWARPWLDLARYADSNGFEKDRLRSMWAYRDWVIKALNDDMPFDEFTIEQIAGDLLPSATLADKIATGFHRNTMLNEEGGVDPEEYRYYSVVDRVNTTATVWLGSTMNCAQCHNHKYDPFTMKDYYRLMAFFNSTADETAKAGTDPHDISPKITVDDTEVKQREAALAKLKVELKDQLKSPTSQPAKEKIAQATGRLAKAKEFSTTLVMVELPKPRVTHLHIRGSFLSPGEVVTPGTPVVLPKLTKAATTQPATQPSTLPTRLDLAKWLVSKENPLTARVTVNRIWEAYFGKGIVETSEDFGVQGTPPTHPELLDYLATELMRSDWHLKAIHKLIVMSATYRQTSDVSPALIEKDPANRWLARGPRFRLEAELIRDQALSVSGLLSEKMGGPSVFPSQPDGVWSNPYSAERWVESKGEDQYRRGIYTFLRRSAPYAAFMTFDMTSHEAICTRRSRTDTPLQALTTLNDPAFVQPAAALARRVVKEGGTSVEDRIAYAFKLVLCRSATSDETERAAALYRQQLANYQKDEKAAKAMASSGLSEPLGDRPAPELAAWTVVSNVLLNLDETLTKG